MKKGMWKYTRIALAVVCSFFLGSLFGRFIGVQEPLDRYLDLTATLEEAGYRQVGPDIYEKSHHDLVEQVQIDYKNHRVVRNGFDVDITNAYACGDTCTIRADKAAEIILNETPTFDAFGQTYAPLIAHAGGGYEGEAGQMTYTNSYDAIKQNYDIGHRFFELDLHFTLDNKFVGLHANGENPEVIAQAEQWVDEQRVVSGLEPVTFDKILDLMLVQRDMFLITDTKSFMVDSAQQGKQFAAMYETIMNKDEALLQRVVPQIYSRQMIEAHNVLRKFPSIILTSYALRTTKEDILATFDTYPNIKMFTTDILGSYIDDSSLIDELKARGKKVSINTVNTSAAFADDRYAKVDGYYTDFLTPHDWHTRN